MGAARVSACGSPQGRPVDLLLIVSVVTVIGKEGVSARRSSCWRGLRTGCWRGFGDGVPRPVGVFRGWRGSPSSAVWSPLLLGGRVPTLSSLATCWLVESHSRGPGRPGKVETPWRPSPAGSAGSSPPPLLQGGKYCPRSHCLTGSPWFVLFHEGEGIPAAGFAKG